MLLVREVPLLEDIPLSPTKLQHLRRKYQSGQRARLSLLNAYAVLLIELYQHWTVDKEHVCNHVPSCSEYARIAFIQYGFVAALFLTIERLAECSDPFSEWPKENKP